MRCGCPNCDAFMVHADDQEVCVCPQCLYRCNACLGTNSVLDRQTVLSMKRMHDKQDERRDDDAEHQGKA